SACGRSSPSAPPSSRSDCSPGSRTAASSPPRSPNPARRSRPSPPCGSRAARSPAPSPRSATPPRPGPWWCRCPRRRGRPSSSSPPPRPARRSRPPPARLGSLGVPEYAVRFGATPVDDDDVLRGSGEESAVEVFRRLVLAACTAHADGLISGSLEMTADYLKEREQFGRPLGSFQAVQQELADVYIVSRTLHV